MFVSIDTPLAFVISLAGCSSFKQSSAVQLQQVTIGKDLTFDLYDRCVSAGNPQPPFGESSEKIDLNKLAFSPRFNNSRRDFLTEFIVG